MIPTSIRSLLLRRPQFGLKRLLAAVAICGIVFAAVKALGLVGLVAAAWTFLLIAAHVFANAWGSKIPSCRAQRALEAPPGSSDDPAFGEVHQVALRTRRLAIVCPCRLGQSASFGWPLVVTTLLAAYVGGLSGGYALWHAGIADRTLVGLVLGTLSTAVIGGFAGFLGGTFFKVTAGAWKEAARPAAHNEL